jgi:hypothetical protein
MPVPVPVLVPEMKIPNYKLKILPTRPDLIADCGLKILPTRPF